MEDKNKVKTAKNRLASGFTLVEIMIVVAIIGLLASIAIPNFVKARASAQANTCIHNLHEIDAATQEWALENNQTQFATVSLAGITKYLGRITGGTLSGCICPADPAQTFATSYTVTTVNVSPTCNIASGTHILN